MPSARAGNGGAALDGKPARGEPGGGSAAPGGAPRAAAPLRPGAGPSKGLAPPGS